LAASGEHVLAKRLWQNLGKLLRIQAQPQKRIAYSGNQLRTAATHQAKESSMKRFLLIMTAMALVLVFCRTVMGNDRNGHQFDDRRFDLCPDAFRHYRMPFGRSISTGMTFASSALHRSILTGMTLGRSISTGMNFAGSITTRMTFLCGSMTTAFITATLES